MGLDRWFAAGLVTQVAFLVLRLTDSVSWAWPVVLIPLIIAGTALTGLLAIIVTVRVVTRMIG